MLQLASASASCLIALEVPHLKMAALKRKRNACDPENTQTASFTEVQYLAGMPEGVAELADVKLVVEGCELAVHSYALSKSPVLVAAVSAASNDAQRVCQVPLPGETKQDVLLVLKHLYAQDAVIQSVDDAQTLAKFAHKYNLEQLHKLSERCIVDRMAFRNDTVIGWMQIAEHLEMNLLLAHCELFFIRNFRSMSAADKQVHSVSQKSLLRIMDGLAGRGADVPDWSRSLCHTSPPKFCTGCRSIFDCRHCPTPHCKEPTLGIRRVFDSAIFTMGTAAAPSIEQLLQWQKE